MIHDEPTKVIIGLLFASSYFFLMFPKQLLKEECSGASNVLRWKLPVFWQTFHPELAQFEVHNLVPFNLNDGTAMLTMSISLPNVGICAKKSLLLSLFQIIFLC